MVLYNKKRRVSLALRLRQSDHGLGNTAQDVDFFGASCARLKSWLSRGMSFGRCRVEEADGSERLLPVRQHAQYLGGIGQRAPARPPARQNRPGPGAIRRQ